MIGFLRATRAVLIDGLPINPASLLLAFAVGVLVTVAAAALPAAAAARIGPLDALRPSRQPSRTLVGRLRWVIGLEVVLLAIGLVAYPLARGNASLPAILLAVVVLVSGAALTAVAVDPIGRVVGRPFEWFFGAEGLLGRAHLGRDRVRSGLTVGALLIGLAAVVALGTVAESAAGNRGALGRLDPAGRLRGPARGSGARCRRPPDPREDNGGCRGDADRGVPRGRGISQQAARGAHGGDRPRDLRARRDP